jgi:Na+/H+ antiporter NhaD/arsenite permease-like protein
MATITHPHNPPGIVRGSRDRAFYTGLATVMAITVLVGFGQTYYFRLLSGTPTTITGGSITSTLHLHGLLFSGWVVLFLVQTALIASRKLAVHRTLGYASLLLAAAMVVVGLRTAIESAARGAAPPGVDATTFLVVPLVDILLFAGFYAAAMLKRRDKETHKRLMLLAYASIITAAVARLPGVLPLGPLVRLRVARTNSSGLPLWRPDTRAFGANPSRGLRDGGVAGVCAMADAVDLHRTDVAGRRRPRRIAESITSVDASQRVNATGA